MMTIPFRLRHRALLYIGCMLALLSGVMLGGCSSDNSEALPALLATVPADAGGAATIRIEEILKKSGCKFTSDGVKLSDNIRKMVDSLSNPFEKTMAALLIEGKGGVDQSGIVIFGASRTYLTGLLDDPEAFRACVEKTAGVTFEVSGENGIASPYAYVGNQFWVALTSTPDLMDLQRYHNLSENQSIVSRKGIEMLKAGKSEIAALIDLQTALRGAGLSNNLPVAMATVFDSPSQIALEGKVKSEEFQMTATILDNSGKPSKFLLPTTKIETSGIAKMNTRANWVGAVSISEDMVKKISSLLGPFGAQLLGPDSPLMQIQGTCVVSEGVGGGPVVLLPTKSTPTPALVSQIGTLFGVSPTVEGNALWVNRGASMEGSLDCASLADRFKGAVAGMVIDLGEVKGGSGKEKNGQVMDLMLMPENNSLTLHLRIPFSFELLTGDIGSKF